MQECDHSGLKLNIALARDVNPDYNEEILSVRKIDTFLDEVLYACPDCGNETLTLYGTMHGCYSQELHQGVPGLFRPEPKEAQCVDLFECDHCHKRFVIQHEDGEPVTLPRRKRKHP